MNLEKDPEIDFRPLSEGLGFHPFADGLPYAPVSRTQQQPAAPTASPSSAPLSRHGAGAVSAGAPRFATQLPVAPASLHTPVAQPRIPQPQIQPRTPLATEAPIVAPPAPKLPLASIENPGFGYAFKRSLAYLLDSAFNLGLCTAALSAGLIYQGGNPELLFTPGNLLPVVLFLLGFNWAILAAQEIAFGTTVFKRLFGLILPGGATAAFLRAFFFIPSVLFGGVGLIWPLFDRQRRCWHDLVVNVQPIEIARL